MTPPGGPTLIAFPVMQISAHAPSGSQPAFPSPTPESKDSDATPESLPVSSRDSKSIDVNSPELKIPQTSVYLSPGKVGQIDSRLQGKPIKGVCSHHMASCCAWKCSSSKSTS